MRTSKPQSTSSKATAATPPVPPSTGSRGSEPGHTKANTSGYIPRSRSVPSAPSSSTRRSDASPGAVRVKNAEGPPSQARPPRPTRASALGMAYSRGAQRIRVQQAQRALVSTEDRSFFVLELVVRTACTAFQDAVREVCAVRACSQQLRNTCSEDAVWEQLYKLRWTSPSTSGSNSSDFCGWRQAFLARLRRVQASFLARTLPSLARKHRRRDGFPDLRKLHEALRMSFSLSISQGAKSHRFFFKADAASIQVFESALCLRCTFSSLQLKVPLHFNLRGRSAAVGKEENLLTSSLQNAHDWNETSGEGDCNFLRSPCGRLLLAFWSDNTLAGLFVTLHLAQILRPLVGDSETWAILAGRPQLDDLDSSLGLHDYTVVLSLRSAKVDCFSNTFYKVHSFGLGSTSTKLGFGGVVVDSHSCVEQSYASSGSSQVRPSSRHQRSEKAYQAEVCHFEVLAPHDSGVQPPFPCLRIPQITFQTAAFKSILQDHAFMDVTVFDEHGHIFWAVSAVCQASRVCPHESSIMRERHVQVDFDRGSVASDSAAPQWLCLVDRGAAQVLVQLEYDSTATGQPRPPRVNAVTWHPEVGFLDEWWGSRYATRAKPKVERPEPEGIDR